MFQWEDLLTVAGAASVAAVAFVFVQLLKAVFPKLFEKVTGALVAFLFTGVVYAIGAIVMSPLTANGYLALFLGWVSCATIAVGIKELAVRGGAAFVKDQPIPPLN